LRLLAAQIELNARNLAGLDDLGGLIRRQGACNLGAKYPDTLRS
jgi:hypothetical protein